MSVFRVNLTVDWEHQVVSLQDPPRGSIRWDLRIPDIYQFSVQGEGNMAITLTDTQEVLVSVHPIDAKGYDAPVEGQPSWELSDDTVVQFVVNPDGLSGEVTAIRPGVSQLTFRADADLGEGITPVLGILDVTVVAGQAVSLRIDVGVPTEQE